MSPLRYESSSCKDDPICTRFNLQSSIRNQQFQGPPLTQRGSPWLLVTDACEILSRTGICSKIFLSIEIHSVVSIPSDRNAHAAPHLAMKCISGHHLPSLRLLALLPLFVFQHEIGAQARLGLSPAEALRVNVDLVTLSFSVKDKNKHYVRELTKEDVVLLEDEVSQDIVFFDTERVPLSLVVLVDVSESTQPYAKEIKAVSRAIADLLHTEDEAAVIAFSDVPMVLQEFTGSKNRLRDALEDARQKFAGATNINDSIYVAAKKLSSLDSDRRRVILLISDGRGNRGERERALSELRKSQATLLSVGLGLTSKLFRGAVSLTEWVKETGGSLLLYSPERDLRKEVSGAFEQIRSQYAVGYVSSNKNRDGRFRSLRVELSRTSLLSSRCAIIQDFPGYFAPDEPLPHP